MESALLAGHAHVDYNAEEQLCVSFIEVTTRHVFRQTAARAYLAPVKGRPNLHISTQTWATKLLFDGQGRTVKAVRIVKNRRESTVFARKEVILSAGAFQSAKLLMLSGIGPQEDLEELNIDLVKVRLTEYPRR